MNIELKQYTTPSTTVISVVGEYLMVTSLTGTNVGGLGVSRESYEDEAHVRSDFWSAEPHPYGE